MKFLNCSLKPWNTFGINRYAKKIILVDSIKKLLHVWKMSVENQQPVLILGEGSNILLLDDFSGIVIINRIMGIQVKETSHTWHIHAGAGENWHQLVKFTIRNNIPGLENLALIPGCAGASLIQNIGAYGLEFKQVCEYCDYTELATGHVTRINVKDCYFSYRESIFNRKYQNKFVVTAIGLKLSKNWKPILSYGELMHFNVKTITPKKIFNFVCSMRMAKLPDPKLIGSAGSFFKNPILSYKEMQDLLSRWPSIPFYPQKNGYAKVSAGWLIEQCQLKGVSYGGASVYRYQALVLINKKNATSKDVVRLAHFVRKCVGEKFNIWLEPEVRFISSTGEVNAMEIIA